MNLSLNAFALSALLVLPVAAQDTIVFTVGGDREKGAAVADAAGGRWVKNLTKGFKAAAKVIAQPGPRIVVLRVAAGDHDGDLGSGSYQLPRLHNPDVTLRIEGGYAADFATRDPFGTPTRILASKDRQAPLIQFNKSRGRMMQDELAALVIDGLVMDVTPSNRYDAKNHQLVRGSSCSDPVLTLGYLMTNLFELKNCVVINSPHRAIETLIRAKSPEAVISIRNNVFLNCVIPLKVDPGRTMHKPRKIVIDHNSFLANWAFNPTPNTSNPGALELGPREGAESIAITNNLFYANFGGAITALHANLPTLTVTGNNFVGNGLLHGQKASDAVAMIVQAGRKKQPIDIETIEDVDGVAVSKDNVSVAPGLPLKLASVEPIDPDALPKNLDPEAEIEQFLGGGRFDKKYELSTYAPKKTYDPKNPPFPTVEGAKQYGASRKSL